VDSFGFDDTGGFACAMARAVCRQVPPPSFRSAVCATASWDYFLDTVNAILADRAFNMQETAIHRNSGA
jgi:hypothetical protein